jgi:cysteine desulfurase/selenocysteine lyase
MQNRKVEMDVGAIRKDFPILSKTMNGKPLTYLDSAATSQKPRQVIDAIKDYYESYNANIHRGIYELAEHATEAYTESKVKLAKFINADSYQELIYVRNTTEAINLVALTWGAENVRKGDRILITEMEHHSNMVPWIMLAKRTGARLDYVKLDGTRSMLDMENLEEQLAKGPRLLAITHASNVLGTINDIKKITSMAHDAGATVLVDGAQSAPHMPVDMKDMGCDFFALSGHKMLGPTGIGALYGKRDLLDSMHPLFGGGDMIRTVEFQDYTPNDLPWKFEAGTPNIEGGIGLGAAIDYLNDIGMENVRNHERRITKYALEKLKSIGAVKVFGPSADNLDARAGVVSFAIDKVHPHDVASIFDSEGVAIRAGHHCAMPLVTSVLDEAAVSRMSFYIYNNEVDIDRAVDAIGKVKKVFNVA